MPTRQRFNEFISLVESSAHVVATEQFYTEDTRIQENGHSPGKGLAVPVKHGLTALAHRRRRGERIAEERFLDDPDQQKTPIAG
ncbi:MAG: hypothetical protein V4454_07630 [Pseudomonadota bacterium]